ncbi:MAG: AMP-binding protein [Vicinamibacterales bacterium]
MALLHFTSGTTGLLKGAVHVHEAVLVHYATGRDVPDPHPDDVFWCTADPGWVTVGTSYGIVAPLLHGVTSIVDDADFDAERWVMACCRTSRRVSVWHTAPTAIRRLMRILGRPADRFDLSALRLAHSVGEPPNSKPSSGRDALGPPIHDNWWQTETGGIMVANFAAADIRPGSMGRPVPGVTAALVRRTGDDVAPIETPDVQGELALRAGWPSMFQALNTTTRATRRASPAAGTRAATSPPAMPTATTGSSAAPTTSSRRRGTWWVPSKSRARCWRIRRWPRPASSACPIPSSASA